MEIQLMEYDHGRRTTPHTHEMSALDRIIQDFQTKATDYHTAKDAVVKDDKATEAELRKRSKELQKTLRSLQSERLAAITQAQVQVRLEKYRLALKPNDTDSRNTKAVLRQAMSLEKHHPTSHLANYLADVGRHQPDKCFTAHHVVQGEGRTQFAVQSRIDLHFHGIRINDPDNGVWMPRYKKDKGHQAMPHAMAHAEIHTYNYEHWIHAETHHLMSELAFRDKLENLRARIRDGGQPDYVTEPPLEGVFGQ